MGAAKGDVLDLGKEAAKRRGVSAPPNPWPLYEVERLLKIAGKDERTIEEVRYAIRTVRMWHAGDPKKRARADWSMVVVNAMRSGWAMRGFKEWWTRSAKRNGIRVPYPGRLCSPANIAAELAALEAKRREPPVLDPAAGADEQLHPVV